MKFLMITHKLTVEMGILRATNQIIRFRDFFKLLHTKWGFNSLCIWVFQPVAEFKEFERRFKFKPRLKYGWFHLKLYQMFQDLSRG